MPPRDRGGIRTLRVEANQIQSCPTDRCAGRATVPAVAASGLYSGIDFAGASEFSREILQLRQAVAHRQYGLGVVDVNAGNEGERRNGRREHVDQAQWRMDGHQVPAALRAILTVAEIGLLECRDMGGARS